jgi:hypothetical protein
VVFADVHKSSRHIAIATVYFGLIGAKPAVDKCLGRTKVAANISRSPRSALWLAILFVGALGSLIILPARSLTATLTQLFPALVRLPEATAVEITVGWSGLSLLSPMNGEYVLQLHNDQFEGLGRFKVAAATSVRKIAVPRDNVQSFLAAVSQVELVEEEYKPRITHTDDYPYVGVGVQTEQGLLQIETRSQSRRVESEEYRDRTPWAINYLGRTFVIGANDLDRALEHLLYSLRYKEIIDVLIKLLQPGPLP